MKSSTTCTVRRAAAFSVRLLTLAAIAHHAGDASAQETTTGIGVRSLTVDGDGAERYFALHRAASPMAVGGRIG